MKKQPLLWPDEIFSSFAEVSAAFLRARGVRALLCDIDNTLVTYGDAEPTERVVEWVSSLKSAGIKTAIASNNKKERVDLFNKKLGVFCTSRSGKPSTKAVRAACAEFSVAPTEVAVIGDQIFTDVLCANRAGAVAILTSPIPYRENLFFRFKRGLEKPIINKFRKKHPEKCFPERSAEK